MKKEDFFNTKIRVKNKEESIKIQKRMFELGFRWTKGKTEFLHIEEPFLYFDTHTMITFTSTKDEPYFNTQDFKEITISDLGITINWKKRLSK